jgi:hypothetical protein
MARRCVLTACLVAAATAVLGGLVVLKPELLGRRTGGPLACDGCSRTATGVPAAVAQAVSMGPLYLRNEGDQPATLERVELLDVDPGLEVVGMVVVKPSGRGVVGAAYGYPPRDPRGSLHPVRGYELPPAKSNSDYVQVLIGIKRESPGRVGARRIAVDYRVGDVPYRAYFDYSMWLCRDRDADCIDPDW